MELSQPYNNVFEALEDDPVVADNLHIRAELMRQLREHLEQSGENQTEAAQRMGVTPSRMRDLMQGHIERLTIDELVNMLSRIGMHLEITLKKAA